RSGKKLSILNVVWSKNSCGLTFVVFEEASKPFATPNRACRFRAPADSRNEQDIPFPLMISLVVIMFYVLMKRPRQGSLSKQDHTRETLLLDGSDPPLRVGIQVWRAGWEDHESREMLGIMDTLR